MAARYWIYQRREPRALIYWGMIAVIMAAACVSTVRTPAYLSSLLGSAGFGAAFVAAFNANAVGMSGPAFCLEAMALSSRRGLRAYFSAQDLVLAAIAVPLLSLVGFGLAAVAGHLVDGFRAMAVDLAGVGAALALSHVFTVGTAVAISPVLVTRDSPHPRGPRRHPHTLLLGCAAGYGLALAWAGVRIAPPASLTESCLSSTRSPHTASCEPREAPRPTRCCRRPTAPSQPRRFRRAQSRRRA